ncbi:MAG TPA: cytochrome c peroxidase [Steroidobacteraceae bacterium]|jgi:cytochrome c peroxidase|nr:cytochrome c peroxidase [Steroidobacteraceae bacterium]
MCGRWVRADTAFYAVSFEKTPTPAAMAAVGRALFFDTALSASRQLDCASCHDPAHAFGPAGDLPVQRGGANNARPGVRAVPSLRYTQNIPPFTEHYFEPGEDDGIDQGPAGGRTWDGRAPSAHDQARLPLFSPFEMANTSLEAVVRAVEHAPYAGEFRATFGKHVFSDPALAFHGVLLALETYQQQPSEFYPYSSKYDAYLRRQTSLSEQELRGLAAFNDPARGNCARCHPSGGSEGAFPQFTDFGYAAIGAPRNRSIPANADPRYFDVGLCGPLREDLKDKTQYCGLFRTPSLRNAAVRRVFFHNGVFHRLEDVVRFYAERDTDPQQWYPRAPDGRVLKFDDLPARYRRNIDREPPLDRHEGERPAMSGQDIDDIVAFLNTLTDGFVRTAP